MRNNRGTNMMKRRRRIHRDIRQYAHPRGEMKQELTKFQLAAIGAVALAYNELDVTVDALLFVVAGSANYGRESISDTNTKIATIAKGLAHLDLEPDDKKQINEALGVFREFTIYR